MGLSVDFSEFKNTIDKLISDTQKYRLVEENIFEVFNDAIRKASQVSGEINKNKILIIFPEEKFYILKSYLLKRCGTTPSESSHGSGEIILFGLHIKSGIDEIHIKAHAAIEYYSEYAFCKEFNRTMKDYI